MEAKPWPASAGSPHSHPIDGRRPRRGGAKTSPSPSATARPARPPRHRAAALWLGAAALAAQALPGHAASVGAAITFQPGTAQQRQALGRIADARELVAERFSVAGADLDGDGRAEILLRADSSAFCGSAGCQLLVLQQRGRTATTLLSTYVDGEVALTREKFGAYLGLAVLDETGAIAKGTRRNTPQYGQPLVYTMAGAPASFGTGADTPAQPGAAAAADSGGERLDILGVRIGMPLAAAEAAISKHDPAMKFERTPFQLTVWPRPATAIVLASNFDQRMQSAKEEIVLRASLPPGLPVVTEVLRWNAYQEKDAPVRQVVLDGLQRKYGPLQLLSADPSGLRAQYGAFLDAQGRSIARPAACYPITPEGRWSDIKRINDIDLAFQRLDQSVPAAQKLGAVCGALVTVTIHTHLSNRDLVAQLGVRVADERLRADRFKASADHALGVDAERRARERDAAKDRQVKM